MVTSYCVTPPPPTKTCRISLATRCIPTCSASGENWLWSVCCIVVTMLLYKCHVRRCLLCPRVPASFCRERWFTQTTRSSHKFQRVSVRTHVSMVGLGVGEQCVCHHHGLASSLTFGVVVVAASARWRRALRSTCRGSRRTAASCCGTRAEPPR